MDTNKALLLARTLMLKHKLDDWHFEFDGAKRRFGRCNQSRKLISLSVVLTDLNDEDKVKDTILHEIAHALLGAGHGHDRYFKMKCVEIGCAPKRTYGDEVVVPKAKYIVKCPECGKTFHSNKRRLKAWHKVCHSRLGSACKYVVYEENRES